MEEILHAPQRGARSEGTARGAAADLLRRLRCGIENQAANGWKMVNPGSFLAVAAAVGILSVLTSVYATGCVVSVDGVRLGAVASQADFEKVVERVEDRATRILGHDYTLDQEITYDTALLERDEIGPASRFETVLFDQIGEVMKSYVLKVDGQVIGAVEDEAEVTALLDTIKAPYINDATTSGEFTSNVVVSHEYTSSDVNQDVAAMEEILTANTNGETVYEVQAGDTFMQIAIDNGMTMRELEALNPDVDVDRIYIGQLLTVKEEIPFLSVRTVDRLTYEQAIECPVEQVEDSSMYQGDSKVLDPGVEGQSLVTADVIYVNGKEQERDVVETTVLSEPTAKVIAVGTKERPSWMPKGYFIWPVYGNITSYFGYRSIFGSSSYHGGLDIAAPYGTGIAAADGGTVVFAGTASGSNWSYGKLVIVDHGNGKQSYYGHCSSILVSAGDHVYQGQTIARVGSTGRSTGNHCHFEVRINGTRVNPLSYLN